MNTIEKTYAFFLDLITAKEIAMAMSTTAPIIKYS